MLKMAYIRNGRVCSVSNYVIVFNTAFEIELRFHS